MSFTERLKYLAHDLLRPELILRTLEKANLRFTRKAARHRKLFHAVLCSKADAWEPGIVCDRLDSVAGACADIDSFTECLVLFSDGVLCAPEVLNFAHQNRLGVLPILDFVL